MLEQPTAAATAGIPSGMVFELFVARMGEELGRPLHPKELKKEVDQILARYGVPLDGSLPPIIPPKPKILTHGGFKVDLEKGEYHLRDIRLLGLASQELALLTYLVEMQGFPVTNTTLMELCWTDKNCKDETTVRNHISRLRSALKDLTGKTYVNSIRMAQSSLRNGYFIPPINPKFSQQP